MPRQAKIRCNEEKRQKEGREEAIIIWSANRAKEREKERLHGRVLTDALISTPKRSAYPVRRDLNMLVNSQGSLIDRVACNPNNKDR